MPISYGIVSLTFAFSCVWLVGKYGRLAAPDEVVFCVPVSGIMRFLLRFMMISIPAFAGTLLVSGIFGIDLMGFHRREQLALGMMCISILVYPWLWLRYGDLAATRQHLFFWGARYEWSEVESVRRTVLGTKFLIPNNWRAGLGGELWLPGDPWPLTPEDVERLEHLRRGSEFDEPIEP